MQSDNKIGWNDFLYSLIYPGFLGSMIYDLLPMESLTSHICICDFVIKLFITLYYCLDYLHLYNDMDKIPIEQRPKYYMISDLLTSGVLLSAFFWVKFNNLLISIVLLTLIPFVTLLYKWSIKKDKRFFLCYGIILFLFTTCYLLLFRNKLTIGLMILTASMLSIYLYYVFFYYEKNSKKEYSNNYGFDFTSALTNREVARNAKKSK